MNKWFYLGALIAVGLWGNVSPAMAKPKLVNAIQNTRELQGAACSVSRADQKIIFWSTDDREALMNINGRDVRLKLVSTSNTTEGRGKVGDRWVATYKSGKMVVKITRVTTFVCPIGDQECEVTRYAVTIKVRNGDRQETVKATGECGS
jgi:hypothetical protein